MASSYLESIKIPDDLKNEPQTISCALQPIIEQQDKAEIMGMLNTVSVFEQRIL